jgi:hypothetical protein
VDETTTSSQGDENMSDQVNIAEQWEQLKTCVESLELDVSKSLGGTVAAGSRLRKGLRILKKFATNICRESLETDKQRRAKRLVEKGAEKKEVAKKSVKK